MRVSTDKNDTGYANFLGHFAVTLDGAELQDVVTADEEAGYVYKAVEPFQVARDEVVMEELYGTVVITELN